jgi:signal transduction histidine kinase
LLGLANHWSHRRLKLKAERLEQRHAAEKERQRIAKNLHDDLGANLTALGLLAERIGGKVTGAEIGGEIAQLRGRVRSLAEALDAVVWTVNPANDSLDRLVPYISGMFQELLSLAGIRSRLEVDADVPPWPLTPEKRSHLFLVAKEAVHNAIKYSSATEAWLRIRTADADFFLAVEDNGRGFDPKGFSGSARNGLTNMRSRVAELGGVLEIESSPGRGTSVRLRLPFGRF